MLDHHTILMAIMFATSLVLWVTVGWLVRGVHRLPKPFVWKLLGLAMATLAIQKTYALSMQYVRDSPLPLSFPSAFFDMIFAGLMLASVVGLSPLLHYVQRNRELLTVIEERNIIIHHFHERVAQALQQMQMAMEVGKPTNGIIEQISTLSCQLQSFLENLKAGILLGNKFEVALKTLVEDVCRDSTFPVTVHIDPGCEENISREQGSEVLHIVREAVRNSVRYSNAQKGQVRVKLTAATMLFEISDDGDGFEVDLVRAQGQGLGGMVSRAQKIGASLKIWSQPKKGTSVRLELPLRRNPSDGDRAPHENTISRNRTPHIQVG